MRILTVSDDAALCGRIAALLRAAGHAVDLVDSECLACSALGGGGFDLVVLDLELGDRAGPALIGRLRQGACVPPIIALAAGASAEERVLALNQGADDCVAAPIDLDEVLARVRVWMRRSLGANGHLVHHGQLTYDTMARAAYVAGEPLRLSRREASLLEVLLHRPGRFVTKDQLADRLFEWGDDVNLNCIEVYVHRLRKKLELGPVRIRSARGQGYLLERAAA